MMKKVSFPGSVRPSLLLPLKALKPIDPKLFHQLEIITTGTIDLGTVHETAPFLKQLGCTEIRIYPNFLLAMIPEGWLWNTESQRMEDLLGDKPWRLLTISKERYLLPHPKYLHLLP